MEKLIFDKKFFEEEEARDILLGKESEYDGIISLCAKTENFNPDFKKSSLEAFRLVYMLLSKHSKKFI